MHEAIHWHVGHRGDTGSPHQLEQGKLDRTARATELVLKEALCIQTTPEGNRLNQDEGYEVPGYWITTMKKLGGGAGRSHAQPPVMCIILECVAVDKCMLWYLATLSPWGWLEHLVETSASCFPIISRTQRIFRFRLLFVLSLPNEVKKLMSNISDLVSHSRGATGSKDRKLICTSMANISFGDDFQWG